MADTNFDYKGTSQVVAATGKASALLKKASIWDLAIEAGKKQSKQQVTEFNLGTQENINATKILQNELEVKNKEVAKQMEEKRKAAEKLDDFVQKQSGELYGKQFIDKIGSMSNQEKSNELQKNINKITEDVSSGILNTKYAEGMINVLQSKLPTYMEDARKDNERDATNIYSDMIASASDDELPEIMGNINAIGLSKETQDNTKLLGYVKRVKKGASELSLNDPDYDTKLGKIQESIMATKTSISESGKDPESNPQIKEQLNQLSEIERDLKNKQKMHFKGLIDDAKKGNLDSAYTKDISYDTFLRAYGDDIVGANNAYDEYSNERLKAEQAREVYYNRDNVPKSVINKMTKESKLFKERYEVDVVTQLNNVISSNDTRGLVKLGLDNPDIIKENFGVNIVSELSNLINETPTQENKRALNGAIGEQISFIRSIKEATPEGSAMLKGVIGEANLNKYSQIGLIAEYKTSGDFIQALQDYKSVDLSPEKLNKVGGSTASSIYKLLEKHPDRNEIMYTVNVLNTIMPEAITADFVEDKILKGREPISKEGLDGKEINFYNSSGKTSLNIASFTPKMIHEINPNITTAIQKGNNIEFKTEYGTAGVINYEAFEQLQKEAMIKFAETEGGSSSTTGKVSQVAKGVTTEVFDLYANNSPTPIGIGTGIVRKIYKEMFSESVLPASKYAEEVLDNDFSKALTYGKDAKNMTEDEKQNISKLLKLNIDLYNVDMKDSGIHIEDRLKAGRLKVKAQKEYDSFVNKYL